MGPSGSSTSTMAYRSCERLWRTTSPGSSGSAAVRRCAPPATSTSPTPTDSSRSRTTRTRCWSAQQRLATRTAAAWDASSRAALTSRPSTSRSPPRRSDMAHTNDEQCVAIIGAGHAGVQVAESLRAASYAGRVVLIEGESQHPYQRPPLSKEYLAGTELSALPLRAESFFSTRDIELLSGTSAVAIDRNRRQL